MAAGIRGGMGIASLVLIGGSLVLLFFVILSGVKTTTPLNKVYFLQADTSSISGARPVSQWTYFYTCGEGNQDCGKAIPAMPFGAAWVGGGEGAPAGLIGKHYKHTTSTYYYYMWRFGWVMYLLALFFDVCAFFTSLLAPCSRLASGLSATVLGFALFWMSLAAALMTITFVKARNEFTRHGITAHIGRYALGFTWGAWAAMFLAMIMLYLGCGLGGRKESATSARASRSTTAGSLPFWRRQRRARSNVGSMSDSQRRVKDEYA